MSLSLVVTAGRHAVCPNPETAAQTIKSHKEVPDGLKTGQVRVFKKAGDGIGHFRKDRRWGDGGGGSFQINLSMLFDFFLQVYIKF